MADLTPDIYIAAIGRSGSTMLCNVLTREPDQIMFIEPGFHTPPYRNMLAPQLAHFGMEISADARQRAQGLPAQRALDKMLGDDLRPIKWGFKEVQCSEHWLVLEQFNPKHILINVRHIRNIALSFMEKHQRQGNEDRFPLSWVSDYCQREARGLVDFCQHLALIGQPYSIVRYEDFTQNPTYRTKLAAEQGWKFGTRSDRFLQSFNRGFEARRHQKDDFREPDLEERNLTREQLDTADQIDLRCAVYQQFFGYDATGQAEK